ncbi:energy transducer TonB family protein [Bartonella schoenbuchensis]|uniref:TonB protein n=1 Tax=Bartonella schoenbuchensis m07a TaxID=1094496 RepID=N6VCK7_9HYPH|nr:TonB family protein [Bartonella schoenbuchensis]ENN91505.1 TonB protein [Bartonella schoenbuchensis m07a]
MNFTNTRRLSILWIGAFMSALSLHAALGIQFYFQNINVSDNVFPPAIMLTFAQEISHPNIINTNTDLEMLQSSVLEQEQKISESALNEVQSMESQFSEEMQSSQELQPVIEKNDFIVEKTLKKSQTSKMAHKALVKKALSVSKIAAKQSDAKSVHSFAVSKDDYTKLDDALSMQWLAKVQAQLERQKNYVIRHRTTHAKGVVQLEFKVHKQGNIFASRIALSSNDQELDRLAMAALQRVGILPPPPLSKENKIIRISLIFN